MLHLPTTIVARKNRVLFERQTEIKDNFATKSVYICVVDRDDHFMPLLDSFSRVMRGNEGKQDATKVFSQTQTRDIHDRTACCCEFLQSGQSPSTGP